MMTYKFMTKDEANLYVEMQKKLNPNFKCDALEVMLWERMKSLLNDHTGYRSNNYDN